MQFWELDTDHDFFVTKEDLLRYGNHSLTYRIVDRIFSQVLFSTLLLVHASQHVHTACMAYARHLKSIASLQAANSAKPIRCALAGI